MSGSDWSTAPLIITTFHLPDILIGNGGEGPVEEWQAALAKQMKATSGIWVGGHSQNLSEAGKLTEEIRQVLLEKKEKDLAYTGACKAGLWPLFHSMADRSLFDEEHWSAYRTVNDKFAETTIEAAKTLIQKNPDCVPVIWIHDYHLMEVPNIVRRRAKEEKIRVRIGYFMHIPFPPWDMVKIHPWKDFFLQGVLGSDMVAFQCQDYLLNFIDCCERGLGTRVDRQLGIVEHDAGGRNVKLRSMPVGVPFDKFSSLASKVPKSSYIKPDIQTVLCIDSLDFTKGLTYRFAAYDKFLEKYHTHRGKVSLVQICLPSRSGQGSQLMEALYNQVQAINNKYATESWMPIQLVDGPLPREEMVALYRDVNVALITPLRDGMNLYAKEFVGCRINQDSPGVLILSPFIGAADLMQEALMANPYEPNKVCDTLYNALTMNEAEAEVRMLSLRGREKSNDLTNWIHGFLADIHNLESSGTDSPKGMESIKLKDFDSILDKYLNVPGWEKLCLLLDYDGTLAPHGSHPDFTILPQNTREVMERLAGMSNVFVSVITGRSIPDIRNKVGIENITYAGNHGIDIVHPDGSKFMIPMPPEIEEKAKWLLQKLQTECCVEGAWVENKGVVLAYHHEAWKEKGSIDPLKKEKILTRARELMTEAGFRIGMSDGGLVTEAKPPVKWNKGHAAHYILRSAFGVNWSENIRIIYAGDDLTDEDAMNALKGLAYNFRVVNSGLVQTVADFRLPDTKGVETMLRWVEQFLQSRQSK